MTYSHHPIQTCLSLGWGRGGQMLLWRHSQYHLGDVHTAVVVTTTLAVWVGLAVWVEKEVKREEKRRVEKRRIAWHV